jgi:hypothetical protein
MLMLAAGERRRRIGYLRLSVHERIPNIKLLSPCRDLRHSRTGGMAAARIQAIGSGEEHHHDDRASFATIRFFLLQVVLLPATVNLPHCDRACRAGPRGRPCTAGLSAGGYHRSSAGGGDGRDHGRRSARRDSTSASRPGVVCTVTRPGDKHRLRLATIPDPDSPAGQLAEELRDMAWAAGFKSLRELATQANCAPATVSEALPGKPSQVPTRVVITAIYKACKADEPTLTRLLDMREKALAARDNVPGPTSAQSPP